MTMRLLLFCFFWLSISMSYAQSYEVIVLGTAQDAGFPQIGCTKQCCQAVHEKRLQPSMVASLAIVNKATGDYWLLDATPDMPQQIQMVYDSFSATRGRMPAGIALTHAHIGHYTGLMYLGREAANSSRMSVYAMPRMQQFLQSNGPWSQLVSLNNIKLMPLQHGVPVMLDEFLQLIPITVPHRDEFSETVGFIIKSKSSSLLYIPDIDKWERWDKKLEDYMAMVDYAFLDATFFSGDELPGRNIGEIPHPSVQETMQRLSLLPTAKKQKVFFTHLNHTNPLHDKSSVATKQVLAEGFQIARQGMILPLH